MYPTNPGFLLDVDPLVNNKFILQNRQIAQAASVQFAAQS